MKPKQDQQDDCVENPPGGSSLFRPAMPVPAILLPLLLLILDCNCGGNKSKNDFIPTNQKAFNYYDKVKKDTATFYGYIDLDTAICYAKKAERTYYLYFPVMHV